MGQVAAVGARSSNNPGQQLTKHACRLSGRHQCGQAFLTFFCISDIHITDKESLPSL